MFSEDFRRRVEKSARTDRVLWVKIRGEQMAEELQKFGDVVPTARESTFAKDAEQVQVADLIDKTVVIKEVKTDSDERGEWADYLIEHEGKAVCFITGSGPLTDSAKTMLEKKLLEKGAIEATLRSRPSKTTRFNYYTWE